MKCFVNWNLILLNADTSCEREANRSRMIVSADLEDFNSCFSSETCKVLLYVAVIIHKSVMSISIYSDKLVHVQVVINCRYACAKCLQSFSKIIPGSAAYKAACIPMYQLAFVLLFLDLKWLELLYLLKGWRRQGIILPWRHLWTIFLPWPRQPISWVWKRGSWGCEDVSVNGFVKN